MEAWQPQAQGLSELLQLLQGSLSNEQSVQDQVRTRLEFLQSSVPEYTNYLVFVLTQHHSADASVRAVAGLILKNIFRSSFKALEPTTRDYTKHWILEALGDQNKDVRSTAGTIVAAMVLHEPLESWPKLIERIVNLMDSPDPNMVHGGLDALYKVCEDAAPRLTAAEFGGQRPLNFLIPRAINLVDHPEVRIRALSIKVINSLVWTRSELLSPYMAAFCDALFRRAATDNHPEIQRVVCQTMSSLLEHSASSLMPQLPAVLDYMIQRTSDEDETVALEACEFWMALAEMEDMKEYLATQLTRLLPLLLNKLVYSEMELIMMDDDDQDGNVPDREEDVKPWQRKNKAQGTGGADGEAGDGESDDEDDDEDDEDFEDWTLRKCAAATLDTLATAFGNAILPFVLPLLTQQLQSNEWLLRESGMLALGAISDGCMTGLEPSLPGLIPFLLQNFTHAKPLVRSIACWTVSRYVIWICEIPQPEERDKYFVPVLRGLLHMCLDSNKRVQSAACSALANLEEEANTLLVPHLEAIVSTMSMAFDKYQRKNMFLLYDTIGSLADAVGNPLKSTPACTAALIPRLLHKWTTLSNEDVDLEALMECMASLVTAVGPAMADGVPAMWQRCLTIMSVQLRQQMAHIANPNEVEEAETGLLISSMDLISGICQGFGPACDDFVASSNPPLLPMVLATMTDSTPSVRQSAFALLGDISMWCYPRLAPHLASFIPAIVANIVVTPDTTSVCNNAAWSSGEIAVKAGADIKPFVQSLLARLVPILNDVSTTRMLAENIAISIGRLGFACPDEVAPLLETFAFRWCSCVRNVTDNDEKRTSCLGMNRVIQVNPQALVSSFHLFCEVALSWFSTPEQLVEEYKQILTGYKNMIPDWNAYAANFSPQSRNKLHERYGL